MIVIGLLDSELELVVKSGFICVPLLFDPDIETEIQGRSHGNILVEFEGRLFIKSLNIESVLSNYEKIDGYHYALLKRDYGTSEDLHGLEAISPDGKLQTILLRIMPYFIRKSSVLKRRRLDDEELLDLVCSKIDIPHEFFGQADRYLDPGPLIKGLDDLDKLRQSLEAIQDGPVTGEDLRRWFDKALGARIVDRERVRIDKAIRERELIGESKRNHIAALLYIAEKGSFELDGFGLSKMGRGGDYLVYRRTGEYILKDYYDRSYLFPDCRVAVPTSRPFRPIVLESYKHPLLPGHASKQEICLGEYDELEEFTPENIIRVLEDGINALLYGYDARRRNGHHSLDPTLHYVETIGFNDYRL
jgi:hypothetical protein